MIQLSNLELYKNKITEFLDNEFVYAKDYEVDPSLDPLLVPVYVDPNGKLTLEKQTGLRAATKAVDTLHQHTYGQPIGLLNNTTFESLVFPNLESVPNVPYDDGPFYFSFDGCSHIKKLYFPQLKKLGIYGMRRIVSKCPNLSLVEFPKLESIGNNALEDNFLSCPNLKDIYFPSLISVGTYPFIYCEYKAKFHFKKSLANDPKFTSNNLKIPASQIVFDI